MNLEISLKTAIKEYEVRHYQNALPILKKCAAKNSKEAMYYLGMLYFHGHGTKKNEDQAFLLFSKAAIELNPQAIFMVGKCYEEGRGTEQNLQQAYEYFVAASHQGSQEGMMMQAKFNEHGIVVAKDLAKALELYVELSKRDNPYAMYKIGMAYFHGEGIKKSLESAYSWLNKALARGSVDAMNHFRLLGTKSGTDIRTTTSLLSAGKDYFQSENPEDGIIYLEIAAKEGEVEAYHFLADAYENGKGVTKSYDKAFEYLQKAANTNDVLAMYLLGKKYEQGSGVISSFTKAASWYEKAYQSGMQEAKTELLGLRGYVNE